MAKCLNAFSKALAFLATAGAVATCVVAVCCPTTLAVACSYSAIVAAVSAWSFCD